MKKIGFILLLLFCGIWVSKAQNVIAVENNSTPAFFTNLDDAITYAHNDDTLFMPGGSFSISQHISKRIHIIGVGYNPDSSIATNPTFISGNITMSSKASGGSMTGLYISSYIYLGNSADSSTNNYEISRCYLNIIYGYFPYGYYCTPTNNIFVNNIITGIVFRGGEANVFYNNIFTGGLYDIGNNNVVKNNIFLHPNTSLAFNYSYFKFTLLENNIFIGTTVFNGTSGYFQNNVFDNNLFVMNMTFPYSTTNLGYNNIINQTQSSIFVNQTGNAYSYSQDYHLQPTCPGKNAGRDGTDAGIYGGAFPWKEGSVPFNPHIQTQNISGSTNTNGNLNVNIKVAAQDN